jgi:hypothetical protein
MHARPHVSPALVHLRTWVSFCALVVALCAVAQMGVFGAAHYTGVRFVKAEADRPATSLKVVGGQTGDRPAAEQAASETGRALASAPVAKASDQATSPVDGTLRGVAALVTSTGVLAALVLTWITGLGALVAAGAAVPGVDKAVRAASTAVILAIIALPLGQILGSDILPGIFSTYSALTAASELVKSGGASEAALLAQFVLLPLLAIGLASAVGIWFRSGVEAGVIVETAADLDEMVEAELSRVRRNGPSGPSVRAVGALNQAIGSPIPSAPPAAPQSAARTITPSEDDPIEKLLGKKARRMNEPSAGEPLRRLI